MNQASNGQHYKHITLATDGTINIACPMSGNKIYT